MNLWTEMSVEFASQNNYLDELFKVYPISPNIRREIPTATRSKIKTAFESRNNEELVRMLLKLELFPIKDSYVAYLKMILYLFQETHKQLIELLETYTPWD